MFSLNRNKNVTCENFGNQTTKPNLARHKKRCSLETLYGTQCPNFSTKSQVGLKQPIAKSHSAPKAVIFFNCKLCYPKFPEIYALQQHKNTQHGLPIKTTGVEYDKIIIEVDDTNLKKELRSCPHFVVDYQLE